jgi:heme a synthase
MNEGVRSLPVEPDARVPIVWIRRLALAGVLLGLSVVVLGAYVRLTGAGLGCPDWPGCYGHLTPTAVPRSDAAYANAPLEIGKAWREMIHHYAASVLGLVIVAVSVRAFAAKRRAIVRRGYALVLLATVAVQGALGMLTVTSKLKPLIVTLHLIIGLTTLAMLWWLWLGVRAQDEAGARHALRGVCARHGGCCLRHLWLSACRSRSAAGPVATTQRSRVAAAVRAL